MSRKAGTITEDTKKHLLASAADEFAEYGFQKASLRRICANAEVTTGALYFFFQDKEDLFSSVVSPVTERILSLMQAHFEAELASLEETIAQGEAEDFRVSEEFLELYFAHRTICDIILNNRNHPAVSSFFNRLTELMDRQMRLLVQVPSGLFQGHSFNDCTIHWFSHLQIDAVLHIISHNLEEAQAKEQLKTMVRFLRGGALALLSEKGTE